MPVWLRAPSSRARTECAPASARDCNADVEALRDRNREVAAGDRRDRETIDGCQLAIELTEINMISAHRGTVDDPQ
jgi:hypothetical protein